MQGLHSWIPTVDGRDCRFRFAPVSTGLLSSYIAWSPGRCGHPSLRPVLHSHLREMGGLRDSAAGVLMRSVFKSPRGPHRPSTEKTTGTAEPLSPLLCLKSEKQPPLPSSPSLELRSCSGGHAGSGPPGRVPCPFPDVTGTVCGRLWFSHLQGDRWGR